MENRDCLRRLKTWAGGKLTRYVHGRSRSQGSAITFEHETTQNLDPIPEYTRQNLLPFQDGWQQVEIHPQTRHPSRGHGRHQRSASEPLLPRNQNGERFMEERLNNMAKAVETLARAIDAIQTQTRTIFSIQSQNIAVLQQQQRSLEERHAAFRQETEEMARQEAACAKHNRVLRKLSLLLLTMTVGVILELFRSRCPIAPANVRTALGVSLTVLKGLFFIILGDVLSPAWGTFHQAFLRLFSHLSQFVR